MSPSPGRTLIIGVDGLIGRGMYQHLSRQDPTLWASSRRQGSAFHHLDLANLTPPNGSALYADGYRYALLAAGISRIAACEQNPEQSRQINVTGTLELASALSEVGIIPIVFSSDYVFDGQQAPYHEQAKTCPLNVYGSQKARLELELPKVCREYLLLRLSKVYTRQMGDGSLLTEILGKLNQGQRLRIAKDQQFSPIWLADVVGAIEQLQLKQARGLYNLAGSQSFSRWEIAMMLAERCGLPTDLLAPIKLADLNEPFARPGNTSLTVSKLEGVLTQPLTLLENSIDALAQYTGGRQR